ncbi:MAG: FAD binding domain-containing protein [Gemmatimonadota bacterium]|jgi:CO/xanthine dehydrogenase FAD-binding subunit
MRVLFPETVPEACRLLTDHPEAVPLAGGTDLLVHWPQQARDPDHVLLDLSGIDALRSHRWADDELILGATTTYWDIVRDPLARVEAPLLVRAARQVGAVQVQTRGTWAGNIVNASPAADGVAVLMAYDATVVLESTRGMVEHPLSEFYRGYKSMRRTPDQLLTRIRIPRRDYDFQMFEKVGARAAQAITKVGVAVTRRGNDWRVVANSVAPTVRRCPTVEAFLARGQPVADPGVFSAPLREDVAPIDDLRSTAHYRETVLARLLYFGLKDVCSFVS